MSPVFRQAQAPPYQPSATRLRINDLLHAAIGLMGLVAVLISSSRFTHESIQGYSVALTLYFVGLLPSKFPRSKFQSACRGSFFGYAALGLVGPLLEKYFSPPNAATASSAVPWWIRLALWLVFATLMALIEEWVSARKRQRSALSSEPHR